MPSNTPGLWVVATPLGNLGDMSPRGREVLQAADIVLAEDTRRAGLLCQRLEITVGSLQSFHEHNEEHKLRMVLDALQQGARIALMTDAGTPLMADPGYHLVRACREESIPVTPVPGPNAAVTALMASGLPPYPHTFLGFPPRKQGERRALFASFAALRTTLVFYERKDRVWSTLKDALHELGPRDVCLARELTKTHEEFILGRLERLDDIRCELLGEITVCIGPPERSAMTNEHSVLEFITEESGLGGSPKDIARRVKQRCTGWSVKAIYALLQQRP